MRARVTVGSTGNILRFFIAEQEGRDRRPRTGLGSDSPGASAHYIREGETEPFEIPLVTPGDGFVPGALREIDASTMPGVYEFHPPDAVFASGARSAVIMLTLPGAEHQVIEVDLVGYDPYDSVRLGLSCLSQESRHACLTSAFSDVVPEIVEKYRHQSAAMAAADNDPETASS